MWKNLWKILQKEKALSLTNIGVMTISFLFLGAFVIIVFISQSAIKYLENQAQVQIFFYDEVTEEKIMVYQKTLLEDERIYAADYVSKEDAFQIFKEMTKEDPILFESVSSDILPASLQIKTKDVEDLFTLSQELSELDGVEDVEFSEDVLDRFKTVSSTVYIVGVVLIVIFLAVSYSVVVVSLRTTINSRGDELEIQRLVGASDAYIKTPLVLQGVFYGLSSSLATAFIIIVASIVFTNMGVFPDNLLIPFFVNTQVNFIVFSLILSFVLVLSGSLLGYFGSFTAVKKYLEY